MNEITIELDGLELDVFYELNLSIGVNILCIYAGNTELSPWLSFYAVDEIRRLIKEQLL